MNDLWRKLHYLPFGGVFRVFPTTSLGIKLWCLFLSSIRKRAGTPIRPGRLRGLGLGRARRQRSLSRFDWRKAATRVAAGEARNGIGAAAGFWRGPTTHGLRSWLGSRRAAAWGASGEDQGKNVAVVGLRRGPTTRGRRARDSVCAGQLRELRAALGKEGCSGRWASAQISGAWFTQLAMLHAIPLVRYTQIATLPADFGRLGHAVRSFAPCFTQMRHDARNFLPDPKEGPPHLPALLMLHAVFGASETACTVSQLRVAWGETACTVPQLRVAWGETACSMADCVNRAPEVCARTQRPPHPFLDPPPATHAVALRQPKRSLVTRAPCAHARAHRPPHPFSAYPARKPRNRPAHVRNPTHANALSESGRATHFWTELF